MTTTMPSPAMRAARARASAPRGVVRARGFATTTSASRATRSRDRRGVASAALGARARASDAGANGALARGLESRARAVSTPQGVDNAREGNDVERDAVTKTATAARDGGDGGATERASGEDGDANAAARAGGATRVRGAGVVGDRDAGASDRDERENAPGEAGVGDGGDGRGGDGDKGTQREEGGGAGGADDDVQFVFEGFKGQEDIDGAI
jgi:hypothetical protein